VPRTGPLRTPKEEQVQLLKPLTGGAPSGRPSAAG
jgi:hypothetical protein